MGPAAVLLAVAMQAPDATAGCDLPQSAALETQAQSEARSRRFGAAAKLWEAAISACPGNRALLLGLAEAQAGDRQFEASIQTAQRYLVFEPRSVSGRTLLASAWMMARRPKEALAESERVLADHPTEAAALKTKGNAAYVLGNAELAIETFTKLLDKHPNDPDGAYMLGRIYYQEGQIDLAMGQFERALKVDPRSYKALDNLGLCYAAKGDNEQATRHFLGAIKLVEKDHPEYEWPYTNLAELFLKSGATRRAFDAASMAANRNPLSARSFYVGAKALEQLNQAELALNWAQRAAAIDPDYADAWYLMARLYKKAGAEDKAAEARRRFTAAKAKEPAKRR